jgi:hypothetical protein
LSNSSAAPLARQFYEARLVEAATAHTKWTRGYYADAWPGSECAFWRDRSFPSNPRTKHAEILDGYRQINDASGAETENRTRFATRSVDQSRESFANLSSPVSLSTHARFVPTACAVDDRVELRDAVNHPCLDRPLVFLGGVEIAPLLRLVTGPSDLNHILDRWASIVAAPKAASLLGWLVRNEILEAIRSD